MKILLSAFEPFGGEKINPTQIILQELPDTLEGITLIKVNVPVEFDTCTETVMSAVRRETPDAVILLGQAGGRDAVTPERIGINLDDARMADNAGKCPKDVPIDPEGPAAYFSTLPVREIVEAIAEKEIPARISNSAGTYVCNHLMYSVLHSFAKEGRKVPCGFIHVPYLSEQVKDKEGVYGMALAEMSEAVKTAVLIVAKKNCKKLAFRC